MLPAPSTISLPLFVMLSVLFQSAGPATTRPAVGVLPHTEFDLAARQVRIASEVIGVNAPLEFFCVVAGTAEHESILRTRAKPSDIHTALLALGINPGQPLRYDATTDRWLPPQGPRLDLYVKWQDNGKTVQKPAAALIRNLRTKQQIPEIYWVFAGSRIMPDGTYAADITGQVAALVNFEMSVLDVPAIASSSNETLTLEANLEALPPPGTPVTLIIQAPPAK